MYVRSAAVIAIASAAAGDCPPSSGVTGPMTVMRRSGPVLIAIMVSLPFSIWCIRRIVASSRCDVRAVSAALQLLQLPLLGSFVKTSFYTLPCYGGGYSCDF